MTYSAPPSRPFAFDTEFDASGVVVRPSSFRPARRAYLPAEVEALVAQARAEARETALAEAESLRAMALSTLAQALAAGAPQLAEAVRRHREDSAALAMAAARVIAGMALERMPTGALASALQALAQDIDASPRLSVAAAGLDEDGRAEVARLVEQAGFSGALNISDLPGAPTAAFLLEWADGRAEYDPQACAARVADALTAALAAEAGHAETIQPFTDGSPN